MRTIIRHSLMAANLSRLSVLVIALGSVTAHAATVSLSPASSTTTVGTPLTLDLNISGLGNGTALGAFDISVNFNSSLLSFQSATIGDPVLGDQLDLGNLGLNSPTATLGVGTVDFIEADIFDSPSTLLSNQAHSFKLAALTFYSVASGTTPITVTLNSLSDQNGNPFTASAQYASVTVQASPVPLPAAAWLLLSGLAALGIAPRNRRAIPIAV